MLARPRVSYIWSSKPRAMGRRGGDAGCAAHLGKKRADAGTADDVPLQESGGAYTTVRYVDYDSKKHKGKPLYEMHSRRDSRMIATYHSEVPDPEYLKATRNCRGTASSRSKTRSADPATAQTFKQAPKVVQAKPDQ